MTRDQLLEALDNAHRTRTYGGDGSTLYGHAAVEIRHLVHTIERLRERLHHCNEYALELQNIVQLDNAMNRATARVAADETDAGT